MQDEALTGLLNVRIQSYLVSKKSHRFASIASDLRVKVLLRTPFVDIFLQNIRR
jgi:hypothetical protein